MGLRLDQREVRRADVAVRAHHGEEVREAGDADALVGLQAVAPTRTRRAMRPPRPGDGERRNAVDVHHLETGGQDQHVDVAGGAVGGGDARTR